MRSLPSATGLPRAASFSRLLDVAARRRATGEEAHSLVICTRPFTTRLLHKDEIVALTLLDNDALRNRIGAQNGAPDVSTLNVTLEVCPNLVCLLSQRRQVI